MANLADMDIPVVMQKLAQFLGTRTDGEYGLVIDGCRLFPSVSLSDAVVLASKMGLTLAFSNTHQTVTASHGLVGGSLSASTLDKPVETATIEAILNASYGVATYCRR